MALTWRNVDAPDFSPSLQGYRVFSDLLGNAFGGLQGGLRTFDKSISDKVNTALQLRLAGAQSPDDARAIVASLATDPNAARISAPTIEMATARPGALIQQAMAQDSLNFTTGQHARTVTQQGAEDATAPLVPDYLVAAANGKGPEWRAAPGHEGFGRGLSLAANTQLFNSGQDAERTAVGTQGAKITNAGGLISNETNAFGLSNAREDRASQDAANTFIANYRKSGHSGDDLDGAIASSGLSGRAAMLVYNSIGGGIGSGSGSGGGMGGGGGGGSGAGGFAGSGDPSRLVNNDAGGGYLPDSVQTVGQFVNYGSALNSSGAKSSSTGIYQINGSTMKEFAPSALGSDWQNRPFDAKAQDAVAKAIFDSAKSSKDAAAALRGRWVSLSPAQAEQLVKLPWEAARGQISAGESGVRNPEALLDDRPTPAGLTIGNVLAGQVAANQQMQANANSIAVAIQPALGSNKSMLETIQGLTGKGGALEGANQDWVSRQIDGIMASAKNGPHPIQLNPEAAAVVLSRAARPKTTGFLEKPDWFPGSNAIGGNLEVNPDAVKSYVDQLTSADYQKTVVGNASIQLRDQQINVAKTAWDAARTRLIQAQQKAANNPSFDKSILGRLNMEELQAAQAYQAANRAQFGAGQAAGGAGPSIPVPPTPRPAAVAVRRPAPPVVAASPVPDPVAAHMAASRSAELMQYYLQQKR